MAGKRDRKSVTDFDQHPSKKRKTIPAPSTSNSKANSFSEPNASEGSGYGARFNYHANTQAQPIHQHHQPNSTHIMSNAIDDIKERFRRFWEDLDSLLPDAKAEIDRMAWMVNPDAKEWQHKWHMERLAWEAYDAKFPGFETIYPYPSDSFQTPEVANAQYKLVYGILKEGKSGESVGSASSAKMSMGNANVSDPAPSDDPEHGATTRSTEPNVSTNSTSGGTYASQVAPDTLKAQGVPKNQTLQPWVEEEFALSPLQHKLFITRPTLNSSAPVERIAKACNARFKFIAGGEARKWKFSGDSKSVRRAHYSIYKVFRDESLPVMRAMLHQKPLPADQSLIKRPDTWSKIIVAYDLVKGTGPKSSGELIPTGCQNVEVLPAGPAILEEMPEISQLPTQGSSATSNADRPAATAEPEISQQLTQGSAADRSVATAKKGKAVKLEAPSAQSSSATTNQSSSQNPVSPKVVVEEEIEAESSAPPPKAKSPEEIAKEKEEAEAEAARVNEWVEGGF